jgi:cystine transport system substrate-binding protein
LDDKEQTMASRNPEAGEMRLTLAGKLLIFLVGVAVLAYAGWTYRDRLPFELPGLGGGGGSAGPAAPSGPATTPGTDPPGPGSPAAKGAVLGRVRQSGVLRVGMEPDAPPLHFINDRKQEDGFDFRLAGTVAEGLGAKRVEVVEADYDDLPDKLRDGSIDLIIAGYVPDESIRGIIWSQGYLDFGLCMIVQEGMAWTLKSPADLAGKRVAIYDDPAAERWVKENIPNARITKFSGDEGWFEAVEKGNADALIYDYPFAAVEIREHPQTVIVKYNLNQSKYAVGIPEGNYDLVYEINKIIDQFVNSPRYADLMREYLASSSEVFMQPIPGRKTYTVRQGDTLSRIAAAQLGATDRWKDLWELNRDRVANPNLIYPKLVLLMP